MVSQRSNKIVAIVGPTASGKSEMAVRIAKEFNGEVISADSRQVYRGMDIGTGKIKEEEKEGIPHHLLDIASPRRKFSASQFKRRAEKKIEQISRKGKLPVICGGTNFYIKILVEGIIIPEVKPDWGLRKSLEGRSPHELYEELKKMDPARARSIEKDNKRRLIRAIEIVKRTGKPVPRTRKDPKFNALLLGIDIPQEDLDQRIERRLYKRIQEGMIEEVKALHHSGISWKKMEEFGLEYEWIAKYLQNKVEYQEMMEGLLRDIRRFSKKQKSWWKDDETIIWIKSFEEVKKETRRFLDH